MAPPQVVTHSITFPPPQRITDVINRDDCYDDDQRVFDYTDCSGVPGCWVVTPILRGRRRPSAFPLPRKTFDLTLSAQKPVTAKFLRAAGQVATASLGVVNSWKAKQQVPPIDDVLFLDSVEALAEKIRKGEYSCVKVTNSFISRLKKVDEVLNCVTRADFKGALKDARRADKLVKTYPVDTLKRAFPLLGVPFCVPENMAVAGFPCTAGILVRKNEVAESTLFLVDNVRRAGAIFLAQTNVSEYGLSVDTENPVYGKTHNPYDTRRVAGGDWGGAAALVSSGGCPFAIGLEMTGSCRISAAFCGLFAHTVPVPDELVEGMYQPAILCHGLAVAGVLTKFPSDLPLVLTVMRAPAMRRLWGPRSYFDNVGSTSSSSCGFWDSFCS